jgi:hypothetical protein
MGNWIPFSALELDGGWLYKFTLVPLIREEITSDTPTLNVWVHVKSDLVMLTKRIFYATNGNWPGLPTHSQSLYCLISLYSDSSPVCYYFKCSKNIIWFRKWEYICGSSRYEYMHWYRGDLSLVSYGSLHAPFYVPSLVALKQWHKQEGISETSISFI